MKNALKYILFTAIAISTALLLLSCGEKYDDTPYIPEYTTEEITTPAESLAEESTAVETAAVDETTVGETTFIEETTEEETTAAEETTAGRSDLIVDISDALYSYADMEADLAALAEKYPEKFTFRSLGKTHEGRDIYVGMIGKQDAEKTIVITASTHAREYITTKVLMAQAENILANSATAEYNGKTFAEILENYTIAIFPMLNPDGVMLAQDGISSLTTDEARAVVNSVYGSVDTTLTIDEFTAYYWKSNAMGVDLNRNAPLAGWETNDPGAVVPYFMNYKGASAGSEPETQAFVGFVDSTENIVFVAAYHTAGHVVYWNCGEMTAVGDTAKALALLTQTETAAAGQKFSVNWDKHFDSSLTDWCMLGKKIPAITVEMCDVEYPMSDSEFEAAYTQTLYLIPAYAEHFNQKTEE